jgi:hypothetical protein
MQRLQQHKTRGESERLAAELQKLKKATLEKERKINIGPSSVKVVLVLAAANMKFYF